VDQAQFGRVEGRFYGFNLLPSAYVINEYGYFILRKHGKAGGLDSSWV
jgi:hypothetical protein